ncbi:MAG: vanadium-dependent haloperoxidase [Solirubrobacteraceae bacterium]
MNVQHCSRRLTRGLTASVAALALAAPAASAHHSSSSVVSTWNENAGKAAVAACISPVGPSPAEVRLYAMTHVAIHDALNAIDRRSRPYAYFGRARRHASPDAAVAAAAHDVLVPVVGQVVGLVGQACVDAAVASVEADYAAALAGVPDGRAKVRGIAVGQAAAAAILELRSTDRAQELLVGDPFYPQSTLPGEYRFTVDPFAFAPKLGEMTPFVLREGSQYRPGPPHAVTDPRYTADFNEIKRLGGDGDGTPSARTPDLTEIALFWYESSPLQWNRIARTIGARLDPWEQARLLGLLNMAMTDGYISSFETKYHYNYWRPVTAIRLGDSDGNPGTAGDPGWTPLRPTPAIPDYDSGHAVEGGTATEVLRRFFHRDRLAFSTCSTTVPVVDSTCDRFRSYRSFSQAAAENGLSRILIGYHFREAVEVGIEHGRKIGDRAVDRFMRPSRR